MPGLRIAAVGRSDLQSTRKEHFTRLLTKVACCVVAAVLASGCASDPTEAFSRADSGDPIDAATPGDLIDAAGPGQVDSGVATARGGLYTWTFGGIEALDVDAAVALLNRTGYSGIVVDTGGPSGQLQKYLTASKKTAGFQVVAAYVAVQLNRGEEFSTVRHKVAIDLLAEAGKGDLWFTFRDDRGTQTKQALTDLVRSIVSYASQKNVRAVFYPHNNNVYPTTVAAMELVNDINSTSFGVALNLTHELRAGNSDRAALKSAFEAAGDKLFAVTLAGAPEEDLTAIRALHESGYDLRPFIGLIKDSGFPGPVGFLNHTLSNPEVYLPLSLDYWRAQSEAIGLRGLGR